ncbi:MAG: MBL fold metallo-hydrolase [Bacillales bacterium]
MIKSFFYNFVYKDFSCNTYVVGNDSKHCVVIDPGSKNNDIIDYIINNYKYVDGILLTHGHWDHIKGIENILNKFPSCTIFISEEDSDLLINSKDNCSEFLGDKGIINIQPQIIEDEDVINFNNNLVFKVIATPFHTKGSVCFLYENEKALFSGDTLFKGNIGRYDLPTSNAKTINESLDKLKSLDPSLTIYPGHGEITNLHYELHNNLYLKKEKWNERY